MIGSPRVLLNVYRETWRINILTTLEYRANFIAWLVFALFYHGTSLITLWVLLHAFPSMNGWSFKEMAFLYALWMTIHAIHSTFFSGVDSVPEEVREGSFDRVLLRPLDALFQAIATPGQVFPDDLILGFVTLGVASWYVGLTFTWWTLPVMALVLFGGALIELAVSLLLATASFWVVKVDAARWIVLQLEQEFTRYPISIYSRGVRFVLTFMVPFAFMNYYPAAAFLGKGPVYLALLSPLVGAIALTAAYAFWRVGLNKYSGVGH